MPQLVMVPGLEYFAKINLFELPFDEIGQKENTTSLYSMLSFLILQNKGLSPSGLTCIRPSMHTLRTVRGISEGYPSKPDMDFNQNQGYEDILQIFGSENHSKLATEFYIP